MNRTVKLAMALATSAGLLMGSIGCEDRGSARTNKTGTSTYGTDRSDRNMNNRANTTTTPSTNNNTSPSGSSSGAGDTGSSGAGAGSTQNGSGSR